MAWAQLGRVLTCRGCRVEIGSGTMAFAPAQKSCPICGKALAEKTCEHGERWLKDRTRRGVRRAQCGFADCGMMFEWV